MTHGTTNGMSKAQVRLREDILIVAISTAFALTLIFTGFAEHVVWALGGMKYFGMIIAGMMFSSVFTTAPAIALLGAMSLTTSLPALALYAGFGAVLGDLIVFHFVKSRVTKDLEYLISLPKRRRIAHIFTSGLFRFFVPLIGAAIIASPLPDELAALIMGLSKIEDKYFVPISFFANAAGIMVIAWAARALAGA